MTVFKVYTNKMSNSDASTSAYYPPHVTPSAKPPRFPFTLTTILDNNLGIIPEQAFRDELATIPGPPRMAFISGLDLVKDVLLSRNAEFPKGKLQTDVLRPLFGNSIVQSEGPEWKWQRATLAPMFRHEELLCYGPVITRAAQTTVEDWRASPPGAVRSIEKDMMHAAFQVISNTMLTGGAANVLEDIEKGHADYYAGTNWWIIYAMFGLPHWLPRPGGRGMRAHERRLRAAVRHLVRSRRDDAADGEDMLARLIAVTNPETGQRMPEDLMVDMIVAFLMAGYDTTALALTWTLYLLSKSPEWEARMLEEIERVVGRGPVTADHFNDLVTVQQVLKESLRLYPTTPMLVRDIIDDVELNGTLIPGGTIGVIPIYAIHRHRKYWDDPDRFDPERFSPDNPSKPARYQFMPFGAGARVCMGAAFALIEATIMLATFVQVARFEVDSRFDPQPTGRMFLFPRNGMPMRVIMREDAQ